jgi:PAS domain S-box-containing protein
MFDLDSRERQALDLLASHHSDEEVARQLGVSERELSEIWATLSGKLQVAEPGSAEGFELLLRYERVERQRLESQLWSSEARLNALMDISPEAILLANGRSGRILKANQQAAAIFGYSVRELVGASVEMLVPDDVRQVHGSYRTAFLRNVRKREMGYHPPILAVRADGTSVELDVALTASAATDDVMVVCRLREGAVAEAETDPGRRSNL